MDTYLCLVCLIFLKIIAERQKEDGSTSSAVDVDDSTEDIELVPRVQEASTQTEHTRKNVSVQFRSKHTSKGKL